MENNSTRWEMETGDREHRENSEEMKEKVKMTVTMVNLTPDDSNHGEPHP